jgi:hypothetical protein
MPRPSPWNHFVKEEAMVDSVEVEEEEGPKASSEELALRAFAMDAGLPEESKFLSHWFGLSQGGMCKDQLPRPSAWNKFVTEHNAVNQNKGAEKNRYELRQWTFEAGLPEESRFLSHWFALANAGTNASEGSLPRPSPWNHFVKEEAIVDGLKAEEEELAASHEESALRAFAVDAGLPEESKFLSHWFGLTKEGALSEQLPRPSAWNKFAQANMEPVPEHSQKNSYELRQWTFDAGLPEESRFLSHWFALANAEADASEGSLPRPSPWNQFVGGAGSA